MAAVVAYALIVSGGLLPLAVCLVIVYWPRKSKVRPFGRVRRRSEFQKRLRAEMDRFEAEYEEVDE